jgi:hypothetical protein
MKNAVFWDVAPCTSCVNWRFGGMYRLHLQGRKIREQPPDHAGTTLPFLSCSHTPMGNSVLRTRDFPSVGLAARRMTSVLFVDWMNLTDVSEEYMQPSSHG